MVMQNKLRVASYELRVEKLPPPSALNGRSKLDETISTVASVVGLELEIRNSELETGWAEGKE